MYYIKPAKGYITSLFSNSRKNPVLGIIRPHQGIDIGNDPDNTIIAAAAGTVRVSDNNGKTGFGKYIVITHPNGQETVYAHLSSIAVKVGQRVKQGQKIGMKGTTGNSTGIHLHFEISKTRWTNNFSNKIDPLLHFVDPLTKELQRMLNSLGYRLTVDGIYGDGTISAVTKYQQANRLTADGVAGRTTYSHIKKAYDAVEKVAHTPAPTNPNNSKGDDDIMKSTSPALTKETDFSIQSRAHREIIVNAAVKAGAHKSWLDKLKNGTISDGDIIRLAIKYTVDTNK